MKKKSVSLFIFLALLNIASYAMSAEINLSESNTQSSVAKSAPVLIEAISDGSNKSCVPTHLTLLGPQKNGSRLYVSSLLNDFPAQLRQTAKGPNKLTPNQIHEVQNILNYALESQKNALGFPAETLVNFEAKTGLKINATLICMSREVIGSQD